MWQVGQLGTALAPSLTSPGNTRTEAGLHLRSRRYAGGHDASHYVAWTEIARAHGLTFPEARFYALGGVPTAKIAALLIAEAGLRSTRPIALEKEQLYYDSLSAGGGVRPDRAVLGIARDPAPGKGPLAVASGSVRRLVSRTLAALGITDWFAAVVAAEDTARHKPEPDVFLEAARRLGVARRRLHRLRGHRHRPGSRPPRRHDRHRRAACSSSDLGALYLHSW